MNENIVKSKENRRKIYISLLVTVICLIGLTYALFTIFLKQTENNSLATRTCFSTSLTEATSKITLDKAYPLTHEKGLETTPFTFKLTNNCDKPVKVYITIDSTYRTSTSSSYLSDSYIRENINLKGETTAPSVILTEQTLKEIDNGNQGYLIKETWLEANEEKEYDLRLWMDESVTVEQGLNKTWKGSVVVSAVAETKLPTWDNPENGTLLAAIKRDNTVTTPKTTPGAEISSFTEALLASTADDYGTSYYFRGAVTNNYVEFANKCWRIVRIGGDGSVKLILHNDNTAKAANPCNSANNSTSAAFAHYNGSTYTSKFNTNYDDNAYVGFMYGAPGSSTYEATHANTNKSTILTNLETWYNNNLKTYESVIDDTVWCNDKTNVTDTTYDPWSYNPTGLGYAKNVTYYGATQRLISTSKSAGGTGPSLKCNGELSKITSKVGLITADELAFAGYAKGLSNTTTYLQENATSNWWWSLSPIYFYGVYANVWVIGGFGGSFDGSSVIDTLGLRASISLRSTTNVIGNGSSESPYIINT